jgi:hypothetical protein
MAGEVCPVKVAFIYSTSKISGKLTKWWTDSYCYHVGFVDEDAGYFYDMNLLFRRRLWPCYGAENVRLVDTPVMVTRAYLEDKLSTDTQVYGWKDYLLFALRPLFHLFGKSTPNVGGVICSEMVYNVLKDHGWHVTFDEVPSPADLEKAIT